MDQRVLIIGAGFAGLQAAKALARCAPEARVLLLDRHNYHTFTPLLYQVATAAIEPEDIGHPVRPTFHRERNVEFHVAEVNAVDLAAHSVQTAAGSLHYDYLIVVAGSRTNFFRIQGVEAQGFGLEDLPQVLALRNHLLMLLERAATEPDPNRRRTLQTIVVVGGGPTGVKVAGAIAELTRTAIVRDFPMPDPSEMHIHLVEAGTRLLSAFRLGSSAAALNSFRHHGVAVALQRAVQSVDRDSVTLANGTTIHTPTIVWAVGVEGGALAGSLSTEPVRGNRVLVNQSLRLAGHSEVYVVGDMAALHQGDALLPMLAPVAMQEGRQAGLNVARQLAGQPPQPFHYIDRCMMATLGRSHAVAEIGPVILSGYLAWLARLALHLIELIGFRNRLLVLVNWIWDYLFFDRGARIILD